MQNIRRFLSIFLVASLLLINLGQLASGNDSSVQELLEAPETLSECIAGEMCLKKDVWDNDLGQYVSDSITGEVGNTYSFNIIGWNRTSTNQSINVVDTLPSGLTYAESDLIGVLECDASYNCNRTEGNFNQLFSTGLAYNLGANESVQIAFNATVGQLPAGNHTLVNTAASGSFSDTASILVSSTGPSVNQLIINEINHSPISDWNSNSDFRLSGRADVTNDDEYIELFVNADGLDLTTNDWTMEISNVSGGTLISPLQSIGSLQYVNINGGSITSTKVGDYVIIRNPVQDLSTEATIRVSFLSTEMDSVSYNDSSSSLLDETYSRIPNRTGNFENNHATPGRANAPRVTNTYEAEIFTESNLNGEDVFDSLASDGITNRLVSVSDQDGQVLEISSFDETSAGYYRISITAKVESGADLTNNDNIFGFEVSYPNSLNKATGFTLAPKDFVTAGIYQTFNIDIRKGDTVGANLYKAFYYNNSGFDLFIDKITVSSVTPNAINVYEAEDYFSTEGSTFNDGGTFVKRSLASDSTSGKNAFFGPFTIDQISTNPEGYEALYNIKFENITATTTEPIAMLEVYNAFTQSRTNLKIYPNMVTEGVYSQIGIKFASANEGSLQFRVVTYANSDIFVDEVEIVAASLSAFSYEAENMPGTIGTVVNDANASETRAKYANPSNGEGWLQYNMSTNHQVGTGQKYVANFRLRSDGVATGQQVATLIVYNHGNPNPYLGLAKIYDHQLRSTYQNFPVYFDSPVDGTISFSIIYRGAGELYSDMVDVSENNLTNLIFESESLTKNPSVGLVVNDVYAGNGSSVQGRLGLDDSQQLHWGPYSTEFEPGNYTASFSLRRSATAGAARIAKIEVRDASGTLAERMIYENELDDLSYTNFNITFDKVTTGMVHLRVIYYGTATGSTSDIYSDRIEITRN